MNTAPLPAYSVTRTSMKTAMVGDIQLALLSESATTRRVLRSMLVRNSKNPTACVRASILHQRRASNADPWQDEESIDLREIKGGEGVRLHLDSEQTLRLYQELDRLYKLAACGIPLDDGRYVVADENSIVPVPLSAREAVERLIAQDPDGFWVALKELRPDMVSVVALAKQHEERSEALAAFTNHLREKDWDEPKWQKFFEQNTWIFGAGLAYRFLHLITSQPDYGGGSVMGRGTQKGDFLMATAAAAAKYTVLVDIKRPDSLLVTRPYRNGAYEPGRHLVGGVCQLQANCHTWVVEGSQQDSNRDDLEDQDIFTYEPKAILVIGDTRQLDDRDKKGTFELFRRNLHNPEIVTYDELLERASFVVAKDLAAT